MTEQQKKSNGFIKFALKLSQINQKPLIVTKKTEEGMLIVCVLFYFFPAAIKMID